MTNRIDHVAEASKRVGWGESWMQREGAPEASALVTAMHAQTHATLALVEQQRIANVIALAGQEDPTALESMLDRDPPTGQKGWVHRGLRPEIREGLGL